MWFTLCQFYTQFNIAVRCHCHMVFWTQCFTCTQIKKYFKVLFAGFFCLFICLFFLFFQVTKVIGVFKSFMKAEQIHLTRIYIYKHAANVNSDAPNKYLKLLLCLCSSQTVSDKAQYTDKIKSFYYYIWISLYIY